MNYAVGKTDDGFEERHMAEAIIEQIADWIKDAIDGTQDPGATLTMRAVRPAILDWDVSRYAHGDVIIELVSIDTEGKSTTSSRYESAQFSIYGIITTLPADTAVDTVLTRLSETIRRTLLAGNSGGQACGGLALNIDCPGVDYAAGPGCAVADVTAVVRYPTGLKDGYSS